MVKFIKDIRRQVLWLQAYGFVGPWQKEWWQIVWRASKAGPVISDCYRRVVPAKQMAKRNG